MSELVNIAENSSHKVEIIFLIFPFFRQYFNYMQNSFFHERLSVWDGFIPNLTSIRKKSAHPILGSIEPMGSGNICDAKKSSNFEGIR